jgi:hypothetical protein
MSDQYKVIYKPYLITENDAIRRNGFSCITFENIGDDDAVINNVIPLPAHVDEARHFNERPYTVIDYQFEIRFAGTATNQQVLVIEAYYTKI